MIQARFVQIYIFLLLGLFTACSPTRHLQKGDYWLNKLEIKGLDNNKLQNGLKNNIKFRLNKKILGFYPLYLQAYNFGLDGRDSNAIRRFFREKVGEEPLLLDSQIIKATLPALEQYLFNQGYFGSELGFEVKIQKRRKRAKVTFNAALAKPYTINNISYSIYDRLLNQLVQKNMEQRMFNPGDIFTTDALADERERLQSLLRNNGYFQFNKEFISFEIDSNLQSHQLNVSLEIKNPSLYDRHMQFSVGDIFLTLKHNFEPIEATDFDTVKDGLYVNLRSYPMDASVLSKVISIETGSLYQENQFKKMYNNLMDIALINAVDFRFQTDSLNEQIHTFIVLSPGKQHDITIEPQGITSDRSTALQANSNRIWGLANQIQYRNKNTFRKAEVFEIRSNTSFEFQLNNRLFYFSNFEQIVSASITQPFFWFQEKIIYNKLNKKLGYVKNPRTVYDLSLIFENNIDFLRNVALIHYSYNADIKYGSLKLVPLEISLNKVTFKPGTIFDPENNPALANLLNTSFIPSSRLEWFYNDKGLSKSGNYHIFRWNVLELAGNLLHFTYKDILKKPLPADGIYKVWNTNYYQFVKSDFDLRYHTNPERQNRWAFRTRFGIALPIKPALGNSILVPFERRFFIGGANSLRGWRPRGVGPGSYYDSIGNQLIRSGELIIETSAELRFQIFEKTLEGALFFDAGNIWNAYKDSVLVGAEISTRFYKHLALNSGVGIRWNFGFFVARLDWGWQLFDPKFGYRYNMLLSEYAYLSRHTTFNFGLGYPF